MQIYISRNNGHASATLCNFNNAILPINNYKIFKPNVHHETCNNIKLRNNIIESKIGVSLQVILKCTDNQGKPLPNTKIEIIHCDKDGILPNNFLQGTLNKKWLMGAQITNNNGLCNFKTITPGWVSGQLSHLKIKVYQHDIIVLDSQLYFPLPMLNQVYDSPLYTKGKNPITINGDVNLQGNKVKYKNQLMQVEGNIENGFRAYYSIKLT